MNNIKKVLSVWMLATCVLPVAAQYPVIPDSVKARAAKQEAEFDRKSDAAWKKALPVVMEEAQKGRPYKPWASKPEDFCFQKIITNHTTPRSILILGTKVECMHSLGKRRAIQLYFSNRVFWYIIGRLPDVKLIV